MFGPEPTGLSARCSPTAHVTDRVRIPMLPGRRSLNITNAAAVAAYEAWRQLGFAERAARGTLSGSGVITGGVAG